MLRTRTSPIPIGVYIALWYPHVHRLAFAIHGLDDKASTRYPLLILQPSPQCIAMAEPQVIESASQVRQDDIIVAFMGPTGSGKSHFIDLLTDQKDKRANNTLSSVTQDIGATRVPFPGDTQRRSVVFVDTPGFDDSGKTDFEILKLINDWLTKTYKNGIKLSGIIYLHRITANRMAGTPYKNLRTFGKLSGDAAMSQVILVTTFWERGDASRVGESRVQQLKDNYWKPLIDRGSSIDALKKANSDEAWRVVRSLIDKRLNARREVLLQEETVDRHIALNETQAGKTLYTDLQRTLAEKKQRLETVGRQAEQSNDPHLKEYLRKEHAKLKQEFDETFLQSEKLRRSLLQKLISFFLKKKTRARAIEMPTGHSNGI
ncbi:hypothetical protein D9756_006605 [Leucocoprinus leucothites]|uniref:G domain-containing protein n=1 Tax=Leucocoprinus leucothites TaxID=201217 RepID=A0A8H5LH15_9AGAR|nr:hypothetical protein D9756_006605 [Leucoagaricus leucothites]